MSCHVIGCCKSWRCMLLAARFCCQSNANGKELQFSSYVSLRSLNSRINRGIQTMAETAVNGVKEDALIPEKVLTLESINPCIKTMEYAVRGPLVIRALEIEKELKQGEAKPFQDVIKANIGDAHAMGQKPITFLRQVLALVTYPGLLRDPSFPEDAKNRARDILSGCYGGSAGAYSESAGLEVIRKHVANYIQERDGGIPADHNDILLCAGASEGIRACMKLLISNGSGRKNGMMVPIPQYPLYSASIAEYDLHQVGYYLDEDNNWGLDMTELQRAINEAKAVCNPQAICVINPGNPTGQVLTRENIEAVIKFAYKEKLLIFADEVYQHNVYAEGSKFHSFKKVMMEMGFPYNKMELASFMSCSKGYMGECGLRGGYAEIVNVDSDVKAMLLKSISAKLCPTVLGQACTDVIVHPPCPGEPSHETYMKERKAVLGSLAARAKMVADTLNSTEGFTCNPVQGAMYAFPRLHLPQKAIEKAESLGQPPDVFYAFQLLENSGICIVPGSGFGQFPGTYHFRTTILPQPEHLKVMLNRLKAFQEKFLEEYK